MIQLAGYARELVGKTYTEVGGCAGVPLHVANKLGINVEAEFKRYNANPDPQLIRAGLDSALTRIFKINDMRVGDVVWLRNRSNIPTHLGILGDYVYGGFSLIHAADKKVVEHRLDTAWQARILAVWRFPPEVSHVG